MGTFLRVLLLFSLLSPSHLFASDLQTHKKQLRLLFNEARRFTAENKHKAAQERLLQAIHLLQRLQLSSSDPAAQQPLLQSEARFWFLLATSYQTTHDLRSSYLAFLRVFSNPTDAPLQEKALHHLRAFHSQKIRVETPVLLQSSPSSAPITIQDIFGHIHTAQTPWRGYLPPAPVRITLAFPGYRVLQKTLLPSPDQPFQRHLALIPLSSPPPSPSSDRPSPSTLPAPPTRPPAPPAFSPASLGLWITAGGLLFITLGVGIAAGVQRGQVERMIGTSPTPEIIQANQSLILLEAFTWTTLSLALASGGGGLALFLLRRPPSALAQLPTRGVRADGLASFFLRRPPSPHASLSLKASQPPSSSNEWRILSPSPLEGAAGHASPSPFLLLCP